MSRARRRLAPDARRLEIVEAAERVLERTGHTARVEDVAREAGVAKGTVFLYFPTFDDLLAAVRDRLIEAFRAAAPRLPPPTNPNTFAEGIADFAVAFADFTVSRHNLGGAIFHSEFHKRRPLPQDGVGLLAAAISEGQANNAVGEIDPEPTARLLFATMHDAGDAVFEGADRARTYGALRMLICRALARTPHDPEHEKPA